MQQTIKTPLFSLGQVVATPSALAAMEKAGQGPQEFLSRHVHGDWGDLREEDRKENQLSLERGFRLLSSYLTNAGDTTTFLNALGKFIPEDERIHLIEDTAEIRMAHTNLVRFEARQAQNGLAAVAIRDLLKASLRHRPDRIILGEILHARIFRLRNQYQHRQSFNLVRDFGTIVVEDLNVKGLAAGMLSKSVQDAGWSSFIAKITYKAENAGRQLIAVNPAGTSQTCICGASVPKLLSNREHVCIECGLIAPRDVVSAQVILQRAWICPSNRNVDEVMSCVV